MAKTLWFFTLSNVDDQIPIGDGDTTIVPTNWNSARYLDIRNIQYTLPEHYIDRTEYVRLDKAAETLATRWWQNKHFANLQHKGIKLGYLLEWEFHITLAKFLKRLVDVDRIVALKKPDIIMGESGSNMFTYIQKFIADKYNVEYRPVVYSTPEKSFHMDVIPITFKIGSKPVTIKLTQSQFRRTTELINKLARFFWGFEGKLGNKKLLMLDFNIIQYDALLEGLQTAGMEVFLLNKRRPTVWNMDSLKIEMKNKYRFASLSEYADSETRTNLRSISKEMMEAVDQIWENGGFEDEFTINGLNFWELLREDFKEFCKNRTSQAIEDIEYGSNFFDHNRFDMMVVWGYVLPFEKVMLHLGKSRGIPSLAIQHGVLTDLRDKNGDWTFLESHYSDADIIATWGKLSSDWFVKNGIPGERVVDLGSPRYDALFAAKDRAQHGTNNIILATSGFPTSFAAYNTVSAAKRYEEFVRQVCLVLKKLPEKRLVVKLHPFADETIDVISVVSSIDRNIRIAKNESIAKLILDSDLLISTYPWSSVVLESMILGKPTIILETLDCMLDPKHLPYASSGASLNIKEPEDVASTLERFFSDSSFRENLARNSQSFVSYYLSNPGSSIATLSSYIARKLRD